MALKRKPGKSQDGRIHLEQLHQAVYWSKKFEVSCIQLYKAIISSGNNKVEKVAGYLFNGEYIPSGSKSNNKGFDLKQKLSRNI
jgi:hypothetical protein